jgi:hypothetical protein
VELVREFRSLCQLAADGVHCLARCAGTLERQPGAHACEGLATDGDLLVDRDPLGEPAGNAGRVGDEQNEQHHGQQNEGGQQAPTEPMRSRSSPAAMHRDRRGCRGHRGRREQPASGIPVQHVHRPGRAAAVPGEFEAASIETD